MNPSAPKSAKHQILPHSVTYESNIKVIHEDKIGFQKR